MTISLRNYWELLSRHIRPQRGRFALLSILLLGSIGLQVVNPQIVRGFLDAALAGKPWNTLLPAALAFLTIALIQQGLAVSVTYLGESVAWTATNALRGELAAHSLNLDMAFHNSHTPGEMIERIDGDVTEMATFFSTFVVTIIGNALLLMGILAALFRENVPVGAIFTLYAVVSLVLLARVRNLAVPHQKARRQAEADMFGFVEEQLSGAEDIRASGAVSFSLRELHRLQGEIFRHDKLGHQKGWIISAVVIGALLMTGNILAFGAGYQLFTRSLITIGTVYLLINYVNLLEQPISALTRQVQTFQTIGACVERLSELRRMQTNLVDGPGTFLPDGSLGLAFEDVSFAYQTDEPVLRGLSFALQPGRVLGLLGRTGSGKTTLTRLVFRLYDPTQGCIQLAGADLRALSLPALRARVAIVTQDVQLFHASVRDNLTFFDRSISDAQITAAIDALGLGEWFQSLPQGFDTLLDSGGRSLSAGEAQLLAFTRVFLRDPGLVILDEASSRLDPATERHLERAIDRLLQNRSAIVIAHRLHTVHRADEVLILEDGQLVEHGPRAQLAADPHTRFAHLLQTGMEEVLV